jgi:glycine hydroxymethyltransferase
LHLTEKKEVVMESKIFQLIEKERVRQSACINLIASENYVSRDVLRASGSLLTNKYAEGYPGRRYYGGCEVVDEVESYAQDLAKQLFNAEHANVQPHSGSSANLAVYMSMVKPGDTVLGMNINAGGHLTHGHPLNFSGKLYNIIPYGVSPDTEMLDYDEIDLLADQHSPKMIIAGASAYSRSIDYDRLSKIAKRHHAKLFVDMAHIAGLVAAKLHQNPAPYADVVSSTTHKTLRGPRSGLILSKADHATAIDRAVFPGCQGGPLMQIIAAKAIAFEEAMTDSFVAYQKRILANARAMATAFADRGYRIVAGGTDTHLFLVDLRSKQAPDALEKITGLLVEQILGSCNIIVNRNLIPGDPEKPLTTSGIRIGTPAVSTRGFGEVEVVEIVDLIDQAIHARHDQSALARIKERVTTLCKQFPIAE